MIHPIKEGDKIHYVISSREVWRPGAYSTIEAANYAFQFPDEVLRELQDQVGQGFITLEMLKEAAKQWPIK